jgi:hypothetical protein
MNSVEWPEIPPITSTIGFPEAAVDDWPHRVEKVSSQAITIQGRQAATPPGYSPEMLGVERPFAPIG